MDSSLRNARWIDRGIGLLVGLVVGGGASAALVLAPRQQTVKLEWSKPGADRNSRESVKTQLLSVETPARLQFALDSLSTQEQKATAKRLPAFKPGNEWCVCSVSVTNVGDSRIDVGPGSFEAIGNDQHVYVHQPFPMMNVLDVELISGTLLKGGTASGQVVFSLPKGVKLTRVDYKPPRIAPIFGPN